MKNMNKVLFYVDGSCDNNFVGFGTNTGGWAVIVQFQENESVITGGEFNTTNQRMEIAGVTKCLPYLLKKGIREIEIITDSMYLVNGIRGRINWHRKILNTKFDKKSVANKDLWLPIFESLKLYEPFVTATWVKGHSGHPENERCDILAQKAMKSQMIGFK